MIYAAIIACEVGFWVVLAAGLLARYALQRPRLGAWLLAGVPVVDLALLGFTVVDLRAGGTPAVAHGLAALYLGFSVAFGHRMVRWADARVAHRLAAGPAPAASPSWGTRSRMVAEWRTFARAVLAGAVAVGVLLVAIRVVGDSGDSSALRSWIPQVGLGLAVWLVVGPGAASVLALSARRGGAGSPGRG
ncbi:hypothetical protein ACK8HX_07285 [Oryzobacter sp. R7]|uniref:hypothetical protein n=1 Tax=Oryzobacter faecalis TaxID=3388656 RepID=UPI00398CE4FA